MDCRSCRHEMVEFATDGIAPERADAFRAHLDACPACAAEWRDIEAVDSLLAVAAAPVVASDLLLDRIREQVNAELDAPPGAMPIFRWLNFAALSGAACVLLALLGIFALRPGNPTAPAVTRMAAAPEEPADTTPAPELESPAPESAEPAPQARPPAPRPEPEPPVILDPIPAPRRVTPRRVRPAPRETRIARAPSGPPAEDLVTRRVRVPEPAGEETRAAEAFEPAVSGGEGAAALRGAPPPMADAAEAAPEPDLIPAHPSPPPEPVATVALRPPVIEVEESAVFALRAAEPAPRPMAAPTAVSVPALVVEPALLESEAFPAAAVAARIR